MYEMQAIKGLVCPKMERQPVYEDVELTTRGGDLVGDGGCSWGRAQASRHAVFKSLTEVRRDDHLEELKKIGVGYVRPYEDRIHNQVVSDEAVNKLKLARLQFFNEIEQWEELADQEEIKANRLSLKQLREEALAKARRKRR